MEHSSKDVYEMHAIVKGRVQGIGFRALTRYHALGLGIKGTVKNLPDGSVEIYAQGSRQRLEELIKLLGEEVGSGEIHDTSIEYFPVEQQHEDFRIIL